MPGARRAAKDALFEAIASVAAAFASGRRAEIVEVLSQGERNVETIAGEIDQSVANTSHHLRTLARSGLVVARNEGNHVFYRLASPQVVATWREMRRLAERHVDAIDSLAVAYLGDRSHLEVIDRAELSRRLAVGEVIVIDVRPQAEFAAGHIPGALSVVPNDTTRLDDLLESVPADVEIVAYCRGPFCAFADDAIRYIIGRGRRAVRLEEGWPEWVLAGGLTET